jgi:hypothetical protein
MTAVRQAAEVFLPEGIGLGVVGWVSAVVIGIPAAYGFIALLSRVLLQVHFAFNPLERDRDVRVYRGGDHSPFGDTSILSPDLSPCLGHPRRPNAVRFAHRSQRGTVGRYA